MTLIRPVILYGSETWASRKIEEIRFDTFERKVSIDLTNLLILSRHRNRRMENSNQ